MGAYVIPMAASYIGTPKGLAIQGTGGTGSFIVASPVTDDCGTDPAEAGDACGPHPDFDRRLVVSATQHRQQEHQPDCPDASDEYFGGHAVSSSGVNRRNLS